MERLDADVGAFDAALQQAPEVFEPVGMDAPLGIGLRMIDDLMAVVLGHVAVGRQLVGEQLGAGSDVRVHHASDRSLAAVGYHARAHLRRAVVANVPLEQPDNRDLAHRPATLNHLLAAILVHEPRGAADESLVGFNLAVHRVEAAVLQREPDAMVHEPRALLSHTSGAGELVGANTVLAVDHHPERRKPLVQAKRRILEDGADLDAELLFAALALPEPAGAQEGNLTHRAARANNAVRPENRRYKGKADGGVREVPDRLKKCFGSGVLAVHEGSIGELAG